jgi:hypothetical protein
VQFGRLRHDLISNKVQINDGMSRADAPIMVLYNEGEYADEPDNSHSNGLIGSFTQEDIENNPKPIIYNIEIFTFFFAHIKNL